MSIHVANIAGAEATSFNIQALLGAGVSDVADLLRTAEMYSATDRDAALGWLNRARLLLETPLPEKRKGGLAPWQIKRIERHIDERMEHGITLGDLSGLVRLSTSHFCKAFKESFGSSPLAHVQTRRISRAKDLILINDRSMAEIAFDCGFSDQAHFSRKFRKLTGLTPSFWRKMYVTKERG